MLRQRGLHTVCESALCPNLGECFGKGTATFLIMGDICTRNCGFCGVTSAVPGALDPEEPAQVADAVARLGLRHVVITSVTRDDLPDGGSGHYVATIRAVRAAAPAATIEVLVPDFAGDPAQVGAVLAERPDVFNHNLETVPRLYATVRPQAIYERSLAVLRQAAQTAPGVVVKTGIMAGSGGDSGGSAATLGGRQRCGRRRGHHRAVSAAIFLPPSGGGVRPSRPVRRVCDLGRRARPPGAFGAVRAQLVPRGGEP